MDVEAWSLLLSLALLLAAVVLLIRWAVLRLKKRSTGRSGHAAALCAAAAILLLIGAFSRRLSDALTLCALLFAAAAAVTLLVLLARVILRRPKRRAALLLAVFLALTIGAAVGASRLSAHQVRQAYAAHELHEDEIQIESDFEVTDGDAPIEVTEYTQSDLSDSCRVYDAAHLYLLFGAGHATADDCRSAIRANRSIPAQFRTFFLDFVDRIAEQDPDAPLDILYHNLQTLRVEELGWHDYLFKSMSPDSLGVYIKSDNIIYIPEGTEYVEGEFGFQVLLHEFCHAARTIWLDGDSRRSASFCSDASFVLLEECMNSVFSCSLLHYDERDIAYQVPSNYLRILLECADTCGIGDYLRHGDTWFLRQLDLAAGDTNYAAVIWKLITLQRQDWQDDRIDLPAEDYYPIYDYLCARYYPQHITADMPRDAAIAVADELIEKAFFDAPDDYKITPERFYENLDAYLAGA